MIAGSRVAAGASRPAIIGLFGSEGGLRLVVVRDG